MLIYVKHFAQMCNRLWALVPVLAYAMHTQQNIFVLFAKKEYVDCFPNLKKCQYLKFLFSHNSFSPKPLEWRLALLSERFNWEVKDDLRNVAHVRGLSFVDGWRHSNDISYVAEHRGEIIKLFMPDTVVSNKVNEYFKDYDGLTVGLHVRRGDYKDYLGGKYCFEDDTYLSVINELRYHFSTEKKKVRFLICSNESFNIPDDYNDIFSIHESNGITDLYALSCCDYIIGPPSSYSQWASFWGSVPLYFLLNKDAKIQMNLFSKIVSFNRFENGLMLCFDEQAEEYYFM